MGDPFPGRSDRLTTGSLVDRQTESAFTPVPHAPVRATGAGNKWGHGGNGVTEGKARFTNGA